MKHAWPMALALAVASPVPAPADPAPALPRHVLYLGTPDSDRAAEYAAFLKERFAHVRAADRDTFVPADGAWADVVVLDWSQADSRGDGGFAFPYPERGLKSPLGPREAWTRPTVLVGSAGHLLAACWQVHGGSG